MRDAVADRLRHRPTTIAVSPAGPRQGRLRRAVGWRSSRSSRRRSRGLGRPRPARRRARRRRRGRREAGQPRGRAADGRRRRRQRRDRRRSADGPLQPERDPGVARHDLRPAGRRRARRPTTLAWLADRGIRPVAAIVDAPTRLRRRRPRADRSRSSSAARRTACPRPGAIRGVDAGRDPDARHRRQPQRLDRRRRRSCTRPSGSAADPPESATLTPHGDLRLRDHRRRPGRRGRRERGPRPRRDRRDHRSPLVRRQLPAHRLPAVEVAAPRRRPSTPPTRERYSWERASAAPRLHGQPRRRMPPSPTTRSHVKRLEDAGAVVLPRQRPDRRPRPGRGPPRRARPTRSPGRNVDGRRRLDLEGAAAARPRRRSGSGRTARRPWPASCRRACSSSAAARPAASWPRSTPGSASRSRSSSPATG